MSCLVMPYYDQGMALISASDSAFGVYLDVEEVEVESEDPYLMGYGAFELSLRTGALDFLDDADEVRGSTSTH